MVIGGTKNTNVMKSTKAPVSTFYLQNETNINHLIIKCKLILKKDKKQQQSNTTTKTNKNDLYGPSTSVLLITHQTCYQNCFTDCFASTVHLYGMATNT